MKKYILPVLALALLTGCGKVSEVKDTDRPINIVSGTVEGTTKDISTTDTESDDDIVSGTTTDKAGNKVSGTTTTTSAGSKKSAVTRANGGSGGVYGTTRAVPVAPKSNNTKKTTTTAAPATTQPATQSPKFDPKDCSSISFGYSNSTPNKIDVSRQYNDGQARSYQVLSADTAEIQKAIEKDSSKTINDFVIKNDYDFDGYPDIFIIEKPDDLNKTGKYYHYDPESGNYQAWAELNSIHLEFARNAAEDLLITVEKKDDIEYEEKAYYWNEQNQLSLRSYTHKYKAGDTILIEYVGYDNSGAEAFRETRDENGNLVGGNTGDQSQGE